MTAEAMARFWPYVDASGGSHACWPWTGAQDGRGYGAFREGTR